MLLDGEEGEELAVGGDEGAAMEDDDLAVDPGKTYDRRRERFMCRSGVKVFMLATFTRDETATGTPVVECRMVCVKDLRPPKDGPYPRSELYQDPENDVGLTARLKFHGTEKAIGRMGHFANALGYSKRVRFRPYRKDGKPDPEGENDDVFDMIKAIGPFIGKVEVETSRDGKAEFAEIKDWKPFKGETDPAWKEIQNRVIDDLQRRAAEAEANKAKGGGRGGGGGGGRGHGGAADQDDFGF